MLVGGGIAPWRSSRAAQGIPRADISAAPRPNRPAGSSVARRPRELPADLQAVERTPPPRRSTRRSSPRRGPRRRRGNTRDAPDGARPQAGLKAHGEAGEPTSSVHAISTSLFRPISRSGRPEAPVDARWIKGPKRLQSTARMAWSGQRSALSIHWRPAPAGGSAPADPGGPSGHRDPAPDDVALKGFDPEHLDVARVHPLERSPRRRSTIPDAELFRIDTNGIGSDGKANLKARHARVELGSSIDLRFMSPSHAKPDSSQGADRCEAGHPKCQFRVMRSHARRRRAHGIAVRMRQASRSRGRAALQLSRRCGRPADQEEGTPASKCGRQHRVTGEFAGGRPRVVLRRSASGFDVVFSETFQDDC